MDLLINITAAVNITFDLHLVSDGGFGHIIGEEDTQTDLPDYERDDEVSDMYEKQPVVWSGMLGELQSSKADMIVAPLSLLPQRGKYVDFTKPFMYPTLSILTRKYRTQSTTSSFLHPFESTLWISILFLMNGVAGFMYFLERFSPFGWFRYENLMGSSKRFRSSLMRTSAMVFESLKTFSRRRAKEEDKHDKPITLAEALWLSWGIMLSTGAGEQLPRSSSTRLFTMVWAGFSMIVVASYTGK